MPVVLITGGAKRIGRGLALEFAKKGYDVGITYHTSQQDAMQTLELLSDAGVQCAAEQCDVAEPKTLETAIRSLASKLGTPDVLVSNAGVYPPRRNVEDLNEQDLKQTLDVNTVPLLTLAKVFQDLRKNADDTGKLISLSSLGAIEIWKDRIEYNVSKAALVQLVKALARSLAPSITVNTVAPGAIVFPDEANDADSTVVSTERIPMGRYGTAQDIFDAVWFFATASSYTTGQFVAVDGGYNLVR